MNATDKSSAPPFWNESTAALMSRLGTAAEGLRADEASGRLQRLGPNTISATRRPSALHQFLTRFANPLVVLLLIVSALSAIAGDASSFGIVLVIVLLSVVLDFVQERQAERTMADLSRSVAVRATVMRDGELKEVPVASLVPGDVIALGPGDLVPADCRLIEVHDLSLNEALLTGEAYPVEKVAGDLTTPVPATLASNSVFQATSVATGSARAIVCRTGGETELGSIAARLHKPPPATAFALSLNRFGLLMLRLTMFIVVFVLAANAFFGRPLLQSLLFALALAVALTPELLPAIIAVTLARGARRLAARKVVVKQLAAIHNLGAMDVLCTDKTGTLTEARMDVANSVGVEGEESRRPALLAFLNSHFSNGILSPLDAAIVANGGDATGWSKIDEVPFDYQRRRISLLLEKAGKRTLICKGAPEAVLSACAAWEDAGGVVHPMAHEDRGRVTAVVDRLSGQGFRLLAVASHDEPSVKSAAGIVDEAGLVLAGFIAFRDPPKNTAGNTVQALANLGVGLKILTGDSELVTRHLCDEIGIPVTGVILGDDLDQLSEAALVARLDATNLFCRMTPADKERVIGLLKKRGRVVGYLGDGVNDAPALHVADIGISVDGAADVAREAASLILLEHDLSVVLDGVVEGRRAVENAIKYVLMGTSSNFGNMVSMAGAALFLPILPMLPVQVLLNNLLYDVSELGIPFDDVDPETLSRPVHWDIGAISRSMLILGPVSSLFDFLTFAVLLVWFHAAAPEFQTGWFVESLATQALVVFAIRTRRRLFSSRPNSLLASLTIAAVAVAALLPATALGSVFGFVPLPPGYFFFLALATVAYLGAVELVKPLVFRAGAATPNSIVGRR